MPRNLLSIDDLDRGEILDVFAAAQEFQENQQQARSVGTDTVGSLMFFEASTRTRIGFEVAAWKLGVKTVSLSETKVTNSMSAPESTSDTVRTLGAFSDFYCIRHPEANIFDEVLPFTSKPVINCGNGYDEHPTQALIDGFTMWQRFGGIDGLSVSLLGQLRYSRAAHSLLRLLSKFKGVQVQEFAPTELQVEGYTEGLDDNSNQLISSSTPELGNENVLYVTGFPPKNPAGEFSQELRDQYKVTTKVASALKDGAIILNPLPRIDEIDPQVDSMAAAYYFKQNDLGLYVRMAILDRYCLKS